MTEPKPLPSETKLVETAHEVAAYLESYAADGWQQVPNAGTLMHRLATELEQSATALASLANELRLAREDARRYRHLRDNVTVKDRMFGYCVREWMYQSGCNKETLDSAIDAALKDAASSVKDE